MLYLIEFSNHSGANLESDMTYQKSPWRIHIDVWQNQYNIVKLKKKIEGLSISKKKKSQNYKVLRSSLKQVIYLI